MNLCLLSGVDGFEGEVVNFCSNNYLGLSNHPRLVDAAHKALDSHGFGLSSVRFICGTQAGSSWLQAQDIALLDIDDCDKF